MDIAYFISDLLGQQGELSVPNLGYFVQMRMNAYYNEQERKFYPPHYSVQFDPQVIDDDDTLATHITARKNISLASSKYFIEKFVSNLRNQALTEDVSFGGIGTFSSNGNQLQFKAGQKQDNPTLFGLTPISLYGTPKETTAPAVVTTPQPVDNTPLPETHTAPAATPATDIHVFTPQPVIPHEETLPYAQQRVEPEYEYEEEGRRRLSIWVILLLVFVVIGAAIAALYAFKPGLLNELLGRKTNPYISTQPITPPASKAIPDSSLLKETDKTADKASAPDTADTTPKEPAAKTQAQPATTAAPAKPAETKPAESKPVEVKPAATTVAKPTTVKTTVPPATTTTTATAPAASTTDEAPKGSWVVRAGTYPTKSGSDARIDVLKSRGFSQARLQNTNVKRGGNYKVILGVYTTKEAAHSASEDMLLTGKITRTEIFVEQIK